MTSLELAILFPAILLIVMGLFQMALFWHTANMVAVAAEEGFDAGKIEPDAPVAAAQEAASDFVTSTTSSTDVDVAAAVSGDGQRLTVTVTASAPRVVGFGQWRVQRVAEGPIEQFVPADER
jgi:hypothetical protein